MRFTTLVILGVIGSMFGAVAHASAPPKDLVRATLLANVKTVKPGEPFKLGVLLKIKPGWHIYWINPGDAGRPTRVKFTLPGGFKASDLKYPLPVKFDQGGVIGYGYRDEVMLIAEVTPPADLQPGETLHLSADVSWLCCQSVCIPGKAQVGKDLTVSEAAEADNITVFDSYISHVPKPATEVNDLVKKVTQLATPGSLGLSVQWARPVSEVEWFPLPPESSGVQNAHADDQPTGASYHFELVPPPAQPADMKLVAGYTTSGGTRQAVEFKLTVPASAGK
jgi:DsbC/DsbD-like thiol-disulfide interchange protein